MAVDPYELIYRKYVVDGVSASGCNKPDAEKAVALWKLLFGEGTDSLPKLREHLAIGTPALGLNASTPRLAIISAGQSTEVGKGAAYDYASLGVASPTIDENTFAYDRATGTIKNPTSVGGSPYVAGIVTPGQVRASELARIVQAGVLDIPNTVGGLSILNWTNPIRGEAAPDVDMWSRLKSDVEAAMALWGTDTVGFLFWSQGESDNSQTVDWYYNEFNNVFLPAVRKQAWWPKPGRIIVEGKARSPMVMTGEYSMSSSTITRVSGDTFEDLAALSGSFPMEVRVSGPTTDNSGAYAISAVAGGYQSATIWPAFSAAETGEPLFITIDARDHGQSLPHIDAALRMAAEANEDVSYTPVPLDARTRDGLHPDGQSAANMAKADIHRAIAAPAYLHTGSQFYFEQNPRVKVYTRGTAGSAFDDMRDLLEAIKKHAKIPPGQIIQCEPQAGEHGFDQLFFDDEVFSRVWIVGQTLEETSNQSTNLMPTAAAFGATEASNLAALKAIFPVVFVPTGAQGMSITSKLGKLSQILVDASDATYGIIAGDNTNNLPGGNVFLDRVWAHGAATGNVFALPGSAIWAVGNSNGPLVGASNGTSRGLYAYGGRIHANYAVSVRNAYGVDAVDWGKVSAQNGTISDNATYDLNVQGVETAIMAQSATYSTGNRTAGSASARGAIIYI